MKKTESKSEGSPYVEAVDLALVFEENLFDSKEFEIKQ